MAIGWLDDLESANDYFDEERFTTDLWDRLSDDKKKTSVITNAYNRLYYDPDYNLPTYATATAAQLIILRKANCEMAYYLIVHLSAEDRRQGLQAQNVIEAGIVEEKYEGSEVAIPPLVKKWLKPWKAIETHAGILNLARDEEESVDTKVHDFS